MTVEPALPPYGHLDKEAVQCTAQASFRYQVPELLLHAILQKENGRQGQCVANRNGTRDCGVAQINSTWVPYFQKYGISESQLAWDTCTNISAAAYILRKNFLRKQNDWSKAIISYNIGPNNWTSPRYAIGAQYATDVINRWTRMHQWVSQGRR